MTEKRLLEIIAYEELMLECAHKRICRAEEGSRLEAEAQGNYTSISCILSILKEELTFSQR